MGRLRPIVRRGLMSPSSVLAADDPTRVPFWRRPVSTFGRLPITDLDNGRSLAFSLPSSAGPPPDWCSQMLSPKLHTADCSSACPGSGTWVDKVPSRDTPSLNLAGCQGGVHPDDPQVARNQSARRWRSSVKVPNVRTGSEARSGPTAATCIFAPTSMAAARGWTGDIAREWTGLFFPVMPASPCVANSGRVRRISIS